MRPLRGGRPDLGTGGLSSEGEGGEEAALRGERTQLATPLPKLLSYVLQCEPGIIQSRLIIL